MANDAEAASWTYCLCFGFILCVLQEVDGKIQFFEVEVEQVNILAKTAVPIATPVQFADTSMPVLFLLCVFSLILTATSKLQQLL